MKCPNCANKQSYFKSLLQKTSKCTECGIEFKMKISFKRVMIFTAIILPLVMLAAALGLEVSSFTTFFCILVITFGSFTPVRE